jgi:outer membrane receptor protein involved in Fe transport
LVKLTFVALVLMPSIAFGHPKHRAGDPAEPLGDEPPVPDVAPPVKPAPVQPLTDAQLLELAKAEAVGDETITVEDEAPAESASSVHLDRDTLGKRSRTQMSDILRQVPGLIVSQHAGGGKADQWFIRGFDADHGTDIAVFADGVPVNMTSHGHGQGYADTHWLIPETIQTVDVHKGPYAARYGDFYTAGALELKTLDELSDRGTVYVSGGVPINGRAIDRRMVAMASPVEHSLLAAEIGEQDGPFTHPQDFQRGLAMGKWKGHGASAEANWYSARWNQSGQLPESLVASGALDRFGAVDPTEGGEATRGSVQLGYETGPLRFAAYGVRNKLDLFSNFTLYARDVDHGDEIEQTDDRWLYGGSATYEKSIHRDGFDMLWTSGAQLRIDDVATSLWHAEQRERLEMCFATANPCNRHDSTIVDVAAYSEANIIPTPWLHVFPGVRVDHFAWNVDDRVMDTTASAGRTIVSPKLSAELHPTNQINFFASSGFGFHSNDARSAVTGGGIARAIGGELGARVRPTETARLSMDVWYLHLSSEQVWSGDAGGTEASAPTHRFGLDIEASTQLTKWLAIDGNVTWAKSRFVANAGNGGAVALAPRWMGSAGATASRGKSFVALRTRGISDRPGNEDATLTAKGYLIFDVIAGTEHGPWGFTLTVNNLFNSDWREAQFAEASRVSPTADLVEQMHFTPGLPLTATAQASFTY